MSCVRRERTALRRRARAARDGDALPFPAREVEGGAADLPRLAAVARARTWRAALSVIGSGHETALRVEARAAILRAPERRLAPFRFADSVAARRYGLGLFRGRVRTTRHRE